MRGLRDRRAAVAAGSEDAKILFHLRRIVRSRFGRLRTGTFKSLREDLTRSGVYRNLNDGFTTGQFNVKTIDQAPAFDL